MSKTMKRFIIGLAVVPVVPFLFWCGGFNFDQRGEGALLCAICTIAVIIFCAMAPTIEE